MIVWLPYDISHLFGDWSKYVECYELLPDREETSERTYRIALTVTVPGSESEQGYHGHGRVEAIFEVSLALESDTKVSVAIQSTWRDSGVIKQYEEEVDSVLIFKGKHNDPGILQYALHLIFDHIGGVVGAEHSRDAKRPGSS